MLSNDELWEKCGTNEPITREDLGLIETVESPSHLQSLKEKLLRLLFSSKYYRKENDD